MPLLAIVDGVPTISTLLSDEEWRTLQADVRTQRRSVVLPRCGSPAYLRTSKLGVRHFAHRSAGDCLSHPKETGYHLYAKNVILQAAQAAGWNAETEAWANGWIADVLASDGARKVAFEIQWSAQTREEFERRQARYAADGVRCAWFARHERSVPFLPRRDLPVFHTTFSDGDFTVVVNGTAMSLADTVTALLNCMIGFREHVAAGHPATMEVACYEYPCYRCNAVSMTWEVEREILTGPCGTVAKVGHGSLWAKERLEANIEVRRHVAAEARRLGSPVANLGSRYSQTASSSYTAFSCPACSALFGDWYLREYMLEARAEEAYTVIGFMGGRHKIPLAHWCIDGGSGLCLE